MHDLRLSGRLRELISAAGIVTIVASVFAFRSDMPYLEAAMLVPCLGAAATILAGGKTRIAQLLTRPFVLWIGAVSYSLYLCHWPIIFFGRFIFGEVADGLLGKLVMLAAMFVVAGFMYRFIERRFIQSSEVRNASFKKNAAAFWSIVLALVAITHTTFITKGFAWRITGDHAKLSRLQAFPSVDDIEPVDGPVTFELVGDSHSMQYYAGLSPLMKRLKIGMTPLAGAGCPILEGLALQEHRRRIDCIQTRDEVLRLISQNNLPIIFVQKWVYYDDATVEDQFDPNDAASSAKNSYRKLERALRRTMRDFVVSGRRVMLIGAQVNAGCSINLPRLMPGPLSHEPPRPCAPTPREGVEQAGAALNAMLGRIAAEWPDRVTLLRPVDYLCDETSCPVVLDGLWLYHDFNHFTVAGSLYMVQRAEAPLMKFLEATKVN